MAFRYLENPFHEQHNSKANLKRLIYLVQFVYKNIALRYYATFKVRKFESLFCKINTFLQKTTSSIGLQAEQIFSVNMWHTCFFNFSCGFCGFFFYVISLCYFQKFQLLVVQKFWTNFCFIVLLFAQKVCLRFLKSYFKLDILTFLSFVVHFLVDTFN